MKTINDIMKEGDICKATVHNRLNQMKKIGIKPRPVYEHIDNRPVRIFTDEMAEQIIDWRGAKPGRKKRNG